jgi:hypothetical protein
MRRAALGAVLGAAIFVAIPSVRTPPDASRADSGEPQRRTGRVLCGVERQPVKILADRDSSRVDLRPVPTTISILTRLPRPVGARPQSNRVTFERRTVRVRAILRSQHLSDDDSDIHLVLADPNAPNVTLVGEVPDSNCAVGVPHAAAYAGIRRALPRIAPGTEIEVEGVLFFDRAHGQLGLAPNAIEIHPILRLTPVERFGTDAPPSAPAPRVAADTSTVRVWLNATSRIYHCPGSDQYGRTESGSYMSEAAARRAGARPRGGRPCQRS